MTGANLDEAVLYKVQLKGADLSEITECGGGNFLAAAWWQASEISPQLLRYLRETYSFDRSSLYPGERLVLKSDYEPTFCAWNDRRPSA